MAVVEAISQDLNNFEALGEDYSIQYIRKERVRPKGPTSGKNCRFFEFTINPDLEHHTRLDDLLLIFQLSYNEPNGSAFTADTIPVGPISDVGKLMFENVMLKINDIRASPLDFGQMYINFLHDFCKSKAEKESTLGLSLYLEDDHSSLANFDCSDPNAVATTPPYNKSLNKRSAYFRKSVPVTLVAKFPFLALTQSPKYWMPGSKFELSFEIANPDRWSMSLTTGSFSYFIHDPYLQVSRAKLNNAITEAQWQKLQTKNMIYPITYGLSRSLALSKTATSFQYDQLFTGPVLPRALLIFFVRSEAYTPGDVAFNPLALQNPGLSNVTVRVGLDRYPANEIDLRKEHNLPALLDVFNVLSSFNNDPLGTPSFLDRDSYANSTSFLLAFDLSRSLDTKSMVRNQIFDASSISVHGGLRAASGKDFTAFFIGYFVSQVEFTKFKQIICPWN